MSDLWYFTSEGKQMEPVTNAELKQLASTGFLRPTDMVWKEGMAQWVKASAVAGLFPGGASRSSSTSTASSTGVRAKDPSAAPTRSASAGRSKVEREPDEPRPRRRREEDVDDRRDETEERDDYEDDRPRRRKKKAKQGMSGLTIGLIIGGAVAGLFLVCGGIVFIATRSGGPSDPNNFSVSLNPSQFNSRDMTFNAGTLYEISCVSDTKNRRGRVCDVDCFIENMQGQWMSGDDNEGPDSNFRFSPPVTGVYRLKVENLDPQTSNRARVQIRNVGASNVAVLIPPQFPVRPNRVINVFNLAFNNPKFPINPPIPNPPIPNPPIPPVGANMQTDAPFQLNAGGNQVKTISYPKATPVTIRVTSAPAFNDVDLFVEQVNGKFVGSDTRISPDGLVTFVAQANTTYRIRVSNLGPQPANCTLSYTRP